MGREKLRSGHLIESLKMERVRTILTDRYPYLHEHSRHLMIAVFAIWLFFVSSDNLQTLIMKLDKNFKWWSMYIAWIFLAALYHLPSFQSMGLDLRMNLSLFLTIYISSLIFLTVLHVIFLGLWYLGLISRMAEKKPEMLTIIQNCARLPYAFSKFNVWKLDELNILKSNAGNNLFIAIVDIMVPFSFGYKCRPPD